MAKKKTIEGIQTLGPFKKTEFVPVGTVPTLYTNNVNIEMSTFDVRLRIGQIQGASADGGALEVNEIARLFMSHQHFLALVAVMNNTAEKIRQIQRESGGEEKAN